MDFQLPLIGGVLIGLASSVLLLFFGRILGVSGILASSLTTLTFEKWKVGFVLGLVGVALILKVLTPSFFQFEISSSIIEVIIAGFIVGVGTRVGSGCTSGHGVCGIPRLSIRSVVATLTFMIAGIITVYLRSII